MRVTGCTRSSIPAVILSRVELSKLLPINKIHGSHRSESHLAEVRRSASSFGRHPTNLTQQLQLNSPPLVHHMRQAAALPFVPFRSVVGSPLLTASRKIRAITMSASATP